jgi:alkylhydroperoxidase/carboxymuconolactone decarboxylase family protein YurZ
MLPAALEEQCNDFYHSAYADGELSTGIKALIGMAVAMTQGCYPCMWYYLGVAKDHGITEGAIREATAAVTATNGGAASRPGARGAEGTPGSAARRTDERKMLR